MTVTGDALIERVLSDESLNIEGVVSKQRLEMSPNYNAAIKASAFKQLMQDTCSNSFCTSLRHILDDSPLCFLKVNFLMPIWMPFTDFADH